MGIDSYSEIFNPFHILHHITPRLKLPLFLGVFAEGGNIEITFSCNPANRTNWVHNFS